MSSDLVKPASSVGGVVEHPGGRTKTTGGLTARKSVYEMETRTELVCEVVEVHGGRGTDKVPGWSLEAWGVTGMEAQQYGT
jgi:hypothetical protein